MKSKILISVVILALLAVFTSAYVVDETEQVVITQFGKVIKEPKQDPGLYFKIPIIQKTNYFPKNLLNWDGDSGQIPTLDKTFIYVDTFARWRITDPLLFFQTVNNEVSALARLDDIIDSAVRNLITSYPLIETVRKTNRELDTYEIGMEDIQQKSPLGKVRTGREKITKAMLAQAQPKLAGFGIELVDVKIKRLNYVEDVRKSVYQRMIAERKQIAEKFRSEGQGEAREIEGDAAKELKRIESEAYRTAQEIKGKADAKAAAIYAVAFGRDADFYSFTQSLDIYRETMDQESTLVLSTDSEFLKYLKGPGQAMDQPGGPPYRDLSFETKP
ncbi:MAG: protease modulator HflC [Desulfobacteraceae bacterium]|jgi:membrane protease subunit HflC